ncbi:MAG: nuclear transport factor 2 family protein [Actinomycetota bacterium]
MKALADAWNLGDSQAALDLFTDDAHYVVPPDEQHYEGREQLFEFFGTDDPPPMSLVWHHVVFGPEQPLGAAENTYRGSRTYQGITLVRLENDRIADRREYQYPSELDWEASSAGNRF